MNKTLNAFLFKFRVGSTQAFITRASPTKAGERKRSRNTQTKEIKNTMKTLSRESRRVVRYSSTSFCHFFLNSFLHLSVAQT